MRIQQAFVGVKFFKKAFLEKYKLEEYSDPNKPAAEPKEPRVAKAPGEKRIKITTPKSEPSTDETPIDNTIGLGQDEMIKQKREFEAERMEAAKTANAFTGAALEQLWQRERDLMAFAFTSSESALDREVQMLLADKQIALAEWQQGNKEDEAKGYLVGSLISKAFDWFK